MIFRSTTEVSCAPSEAFDHYLRVEDWPEWLPSVSRVERLDPGPLRIGARTRIQQPRLPTNDWTVTDLTPGRSFTWETRGPGIRTTGRHIVQPHPNGCLAIAELEQRGPLAPLVVALTSRLVRRYLRMETEGLRDRCARTDS